MILGDLPQVRRRLPALQLVAPQAAVPTVVADFKLSNAFGRIRGEVLRADGTVAARAAVVLYAEGVAEPSATWWADAQRSRVCWQRTGAADTSAPVAPVARAA